MAEKVLWVTVGVGAISYRMLCYGHETQTAVSTGKMGIARGCSPNNCPLIFSSLFPQNPHFFS
ncbi:MAG: hypothetical protein AAGJ08_23210 [Cyanobacteria bacterium P01_H01_bin.35]